MTPIKCVNKNNFIDLEEFLFFLKKELLILVTHSFHVRILNDFFESQQLLDYKQVSLTNRGKVRSENFEYIPFLQNVTKASP